MRTVLALGVLVAAQVAAADPVAVVDKQLTAYNAKDVEAFLSCYAADAELLELPDKPIVKGEAALRERYTKRFADKLLHATIGKRIVMGNKVIDEEHIRLTWPEGPGTWEAAAIYEVTGDKISRVWFVFGEKKIDAKK